MKLSVYIDDDLVAQLDELADNQGETRNALIVRTLLNFMRAQKKKSEIDQQLGRIEEFLQVAQLKGAELEQRMTAIESAWRKAASGCCLHSQA